MFDIAEIAGHAAMRRVKASTEYRACTTQRDHQHRKERSLSGARGLALAALTMLANFAPESHAELPAHTPGTLANPGFEGQPMKGAFFYAGQWRLWGEFPYDLGPAEQKCLFSAHAKDGNTGNGWSVSASRRDRAVNNMLQAGVNVGSIRTICSGVR